jgi:hydroxymethylglutaryl-CoA lyase
MGKGGDPLSAVEIVEVAPRDGLQNISAIASTDKKVELIRRLAAAGFDRMEIGSFVSPRHVPQMADAEAVVERLGELPGLTRMALVPNAKGARRALAAGIRSLIFVISMTDSHNRSNVGRTTDASIADLRNLFTEVDMRGIELRVGLGTAFHCPFDGIVDEDLVVANTEKIVAISPRIEFAISDTTGMATPDHARRLARRLISTFGDGPKWSFHGHDTAGFGLANVLACLDAGIRSFDASAAGLGGCPFAPGATGNIATEDLVYLLDRMGVKTGIDLGKLLEAADFAAGFEGAMPSGHARVMPRDWVLYGKGASCSAH